MSSEVDLDHLNCKMLSQLAIIIHILGCDSLACTLSLPIYNMGNRRCLIGIEGRSGVSYDYSL